MNSVDTKNGANGQPTASGMSLDDVLFTLFRHKWLIVGSVCLGLVGVVAVRMVKPPLYVSKVKLMLHYVTEATKEVSSPREEGQGMRTETVAQDILSTETEIIKSLDVSNVVNVIGAEKILAKFGGGNDPMAAAGIIVGGIEVENPPRTAIITVSFKHRDPD